MNDEMQNHKPVGTLIYYGPDDQTVTKMTAGVVYSKDSQPINKTWYGDNVTTNPAIIAELGKFFQEHGVEKVVMTDKVAGCPHEEGIDYPAGEECPLCPFWQSKDETGGAGG